MTYNVFGETLNLVQSINQSITEICARFSSVETSAIDLELRCADWFQFAFTHFFEKK